jgi:hypothetical protein
MMLSRPIYSICIHALVMLLWRNFICKETCGGYARKSSKLFYISAPKVEQCLTCLARVNIKYIFFTQLCCLYPSRNNGDPRLQHAVWSRVRPKEDLYLQSISL